MTEFSGNLLVVGKQVFVIFILIGVGALIRLSRMMSDEAVKGATALLLNIVTPALLIVSFQRECSPEQLAVVGNAAAIGIVFHLISIALAYLFIRGNDASRAAVLRFSVIFTNAGFMALPLQEAVLGRDGVFAGAVVVGIFQLLCWTYGLWLMSGDSSTFSAGKLIANPGIAGLAVALALFLSGVRLPAVLKDPCTHLANLNTPMAMIVIGYHLASSKIGSAIRDRGAIKALFLRTVASPALLVLFVYLMGYDDENLVLATVIAASAPAAAITTIFAVRFGRDVPLSVELVSASTLISVATMPLMVTVAKTLIGR